MSNRFQCPSSDEEDSLPSTPDRGSRNGSNHSTTPAGPPPSSNGSFTPAGAPSEEYMGSSLMRPVTSGTSGLPAAQHNPFAAMNNKPFAPPAKKTFAAPAAKNPFAQKSKPPPARSSRVGKARGPSRLRKEVVDESEEETEEDSDEPAPPAKPKVGTGSFGMNYGDDDEDDEDDEEEDEEDEAPPRRKNTAFMEEYSDGEEDQDDDDYDEEEEDENDGDLFMDIAREGPEGDDENNDINDMSDLMNFNTPAATERIRREAEDIFRRTARRSGARRHSFRCAALAKEIYGQSGYAAITEPPELILDTERLMTKLYSDGVGPEEDDERLDETLAAVTGQLTGIWKHHLDNQPPTEEEHAAEIGPGPQASPFHKATYLATLALQVHHTRTGQDGRTTEPLPETLFRWLSENHNPYPAQVQEVLRFRPSPASHSLYWQTVFIALLRGQVSDTQKLLRSAGWEHVKANRRGELAYAGRALANVQQAAKEACDMLEICPVKSGNWDVWNSDWTLFRIKARGALEQLRRFAEGKKNVVAGDFDLSDSMQGQESLTATARKAESQVPWEIYENLNIIFEIALGSVDVILETAQDWCEATIGLFGWWDEGKSDKNLHLSRSQALMLATQINGSEGYLERLARSFQTAIVSGFNFNPQNPVEVGMACLFEDNAKAVIAILRTWSLPVASAVAEIASLGRWLPAHQPSALYGFDDLNEEDMAVLGMNPLDPDEQDGVKDNTLIQYAQELSNYTELATVKDRNGEFRSGWEVAIFVLGRMDSPQRSEETVSELVQVLLEEIDVDSSNMIDKVWKLLSDLGMIAFAEQVAEHFGDILKEESHRYGEAMWYYALAHCPSKVREVMNLLISYSLIQSVAYPSAADLDDHLYKLLNKRTETLERCAKQDLEAAELLGKMLAGYATLRKFYELRDDESLPLARRYKAAAAALMVVIASSDDNIRGGLYDASRGAVVSEDFLLALLGEALVFINNTQHNHGAAPVISLDQLDVLLKAVEDIQSVGSRVYSACDEFFQLVLASAPSLLKGSTPADLLKKSTSGSTVLTGSSMLASQLHRSVGGGGALTKTNARRAWDWRSGLQASTRAADVLRILRLGLTKDMARLWLLEADGGF